MFRPSITTGFRMTDGGIHLLLHVNPDIAVFAKAIANGYAMSAVIGREDVMQAAQSTFISSTNWTELVGPVAALATIGKLRQQRVAAHLITIGQQVMDGWKKAGEKYGLKLHCSGLPSLCHFEFEGKEADSLATLFCQTMLEKGYLAYSQFKPSFAHKAEHVEAYLQAVDETFEILARALENRTVGGLLKGPLAQKGFARLA